MSVDKRWVMGIPFQRKWQQRLRPQAITCGHASVSKTKGRERRKAANFDPSYFPGLPPCEAGRRRCQRPPRPRRRPPRWIPAPSPRLGLTPAAARPSSAPGAFRNLVPSTRTVALRGARGRPSYRLAESEAATTGTRLSRPTTVPTSRGSYHLAAHDGRLDLPLHQRRDGLIGVVYLAAECDVRVECRELCQEPWHQ